ncbi:hypothetical protein PNA2_0112 [Pyrococcus sp. NA2]|nr:hypothetical protein PNA2_0112 [Pyrococcus sp. NA2]
MEDVSKPKEREDFVVLTGMKEDGTIEFIKVYAINEELALNVLEKFLRENNIHPSDFIVIQKGMESIKGKEIISTRTEEELSAMLARIGLRLVSNGVLYTKGREALYQITAISKSLLEELQGEKREKIHNVIKEEVMIDFSSIELPEKYLRKLYLLSLMEDTFILNRAELDIPSVLNKAIKGSVSIPRLIEKDNIIVKVFDEELHEVKGSYLDRVIIAPPVVHWDAHIDSMDSFSFRRIEENIYDPPIFLKASKGFLVLTEPPRDLVVMLLKLKRRGEITVTLEGRQIRIPVKFTLILDTKYPERYSGLKFPIRINLPTFDDETFSQVLSKAIGTNVPQEIATTFPQEYKTFLGVEILANLWRKLKERENKSEIELLKEVATIVTGGVI